MEMQRDFIDSVFFSDREMQHKGIGKGKDKDDFMLVEEEEQTWAMEEEADEHEEPQEAETIADEHEPAEEKEPQEEAKAEAIADEHEPAEEKETQKAETIQYVRDSFGYDGTAMWRLVIVTVLLGKGKWVETWEKVTHEASPLEAPERVEFVRDTVGTGRRGGTWRLIHVKILLSRGQWVETWERLTPAQW